MKVYRFYRFDRNGQPLGPVEEFPCGSDLQARLKGREILDIEATVAALEVWDGERRLVQLTQAAAGKGPTAPGAPPPGGGRRLGLGDEIDESAKFKGSMRTQHDPQGRRAPATRSVGGKRPA